MNKIVFCLDNQLRKLATINARSFFTFQTPLDLYADAPDPVSLIPVRLFLCRAKKVVDLPDYHFVDHNITILSHDASYNKVELHEYAKARSGLPTKPTKSDDDDNKQKKK